jgi:ATP-dependent metalloprotease FtsH
MNRKSYHFSQRYYEQLLKNLNSKNETIHDKYMLGIDTNVNNVTDIKGYKEKLERERKQRIKTNILKQQQQRNLEYQQELEAQNIQSQIFKSFRIIVQNGDDEDEMDEMDKPKFDFYQNSRNKENKKSKNFEVITNYDITFKDVGGYENIKEELRQCVDMLKNYQKYNAYNVRIPKGLILEGPPGTGKTLIAKSLAGEALCNFISVSGSDFQEKYVGIGPTRIKELFKLAKENTACIIFIDEIDAVGRKRSSDGETSSSERDNTLNALLVELDGFKNNSGIFIVAATNRIDLLDSALIRPGRIDKKIYIGLPDSVTREAILNIHIKGKPHDNTIDIKDLVDITDGLSGAQIENLLNEAMLNALRKNETKFTYADFDLILNKMIAGWQPNDHKFSNSIIDRIAIHEMGHAIVGILSKYHSKMSKVVINLSSPRTPGYTVFEHSSSNIYVREALFEHLMILLAGRIAEEVFYGVSSTTGAVNDFEEANKLAEKMIVHYGMGKNVIYPSLSEKYKEQIDDEVLNLINTAYSVSEMILKNSKELIYECSEILKRDKIIKMAELEEIINSKYPEILELKIML